MTDKDKLLKLYKDLKNIEYPSFENEVLNAIVSKTKEGINIVLDWLSHEANKFFNNK